MHLVEKMFSAREEPWHYHLTRDKTTITPDVLTMEEAIPLSGLDWRVDRVPIYVKGRSDDGIPGHFLPVEDRIALRRDTDHSILGIHTEGYQENQPRELFEWGWGIIEASMEGGPNDHAMWETGGSLADGKRIFAMLKLPVEVKVDGDVLYPYLGLADSYDGTMARRAWLTMIRVVCQNTVDWSWSKSVKRIAIRHTKNSKERIAAAREALGISYDNITAFQVEAEQMMNQTVTDSEFDKIVAGLFPHQKDETKRQEVNVDRRRRTVEKIYFDSPTIGAYSGTAWGAYNAVQEWEQWSSRAATSKLPPGKVRARQMQRVISGTWPVSNQVAKVLTS